jgi:hypothetical protein
MKKSTQHENKSLKTFFHYTILVAFLLVVALSIKAFFVIRASKFDGRHHFAIAIIKQNVVEELIGFSPTESSLSLLHITNGIRSSDLGKVVGVIPDAIVQVPSSFPEGANANAIMGAVVWRYSTVKTNLTIFDALQLMIYAKNISNNNITVKNVQLPKDSNQLDTLIPSLFTDGSISQEDVSIEIINATDVGGLGKRLESALVNMGANVVAVSTSPQKSSKSQIQYYGAKSYTLDKITKLLSYPVSKLPSQTIANIVIIIGEDNVDTTIF